MSTEANKTVAREFYAQAATGDRDDELIAADIVYHGPPMLGEIHGREGFKQVLDVFRAAFPGFETTIEALVAEDDLVAVRHTHRGTHAGDFAGIPATGTPVTVGGIEIVRIRNGQIAEFWHLDDFLALMQQLGTVPAPEPAGV
jgi:steroid delta-isomerase-like uncharacterized protein